MVAGVEAPIWQTCGCTVWKQNIGPNCFRAMPALTLGEGTLQFGIPCPCRFLSMEGLQIPRKHTMPMICGIIASCPTPGWRWHPARSQAGQVAGEIMWQLLCSSLLSGTGTWCLFGKPFAPLFWRHVSRVSCFELFSRFGSRSHVECWPLPGSTSRTCLTFGDMLLYLPSKSRPCIAHEVHLFAVAILKKQNTMSLWGSSVTAETMKRPLHCTAQPLRSKTLSLANKH